MQVTVYHVNAFTADSSGGNPAGVVLEADNLNDTQMLTIAKEVGFSETAFISESDKATKKLRFFTPTEEVDLCGHATIASWSLMRHKQLVNVGVSNQDTLAGLLKVDVRADGLVYMEQTDVQFYETIEPKKLISILGINETDFNESLKPLIVSTGLKDLIVILKDEAVLNNLNPDLDAMASFSKTNDITGMHIAALHKDKSAVAAARNFAPLVGINEESATGTSNGALLCYLRKHNALPYQQEYKI